MCETSTRLGKAKTYKLQVDNVGEGDEEENKDVNGEDFS